MTREERIRMHQERIERIIQESRRKKEEEQKAAAAAAAAATGQPVATPATGAPAPPAPGHPGNAQAQPGQPLPAGPVQTFAPPVQQAAQQKQAPQVAQGARSESRTMLLFHPLDSVVNVGDTFETEVVAETKEGTVDAVSFLIKYPKDILNPLALDHKPLDPIVDEELEYSFDPEKGEIFVRAALKSPMRLSGRPLARIIWEATEPTNGANLTFVFNPDRPTGLYLNGKNLLGTLPGSEDGVIASSIVVKAPKAKNVVQPAGEKGLIITSQDLSPPPPIMQLRLQPEVRTARAGETFHVDVVLDNEGGASFDRLRFLVQFNPRDVEVLDYDTGNRIRRDVNVRDSINEEEFPFDFVRYNMADNEAGVIRFDAGTELNPLRGSGVVARIRFQARRPVNSTSIALVKGTSERGMMTDVTHTGTTMLAGLPKRSGILDDVTVSIAQAPPGAEPLPATKSREKNPFRSRLGTTFTE